MARKVDGKQTLKCFPPLAVYVLQKRHKIKKEKIFCICNTRIKISFPKNSGYKVSIYLDYLFIYLFFI